MEAGSDRRAEGATRPRAPTGVRAKGPDIDRPNPRRAQRTPLADLSASAKANGPDNTSGALRPARKRRINRRGPRRRGGNANPPPLHKESSPLHQVALMDGENQKMTRVGREVVGRVGVAMRAGVRALEIVGNVGGIFNSYVDIY